MAVIKNMMVRAGADFSAFTTQAKRASQSMKGMQSNVSRSCNAIKTAVSGVKKALGALGVAVGMTAMIAAARNAAEAYDEQAESEIKLATVMRNTMGARNAEIQSILDLCGAQQRLGVISADAQAAGAQELATYLSMSDSLKTLIPVMNDMAAQQYGYNVTAEHCTSIATMLGKVMEGQTGALRRYGYYFSEAEESVLKYGTEAEKAAMLSEIVTENVGGMNYALAQTPSGRMRQLSNVMDDVNAQFGEAVRNIGMLALPLLWKVADALSAVASWATRAANSVAQVFGTNITGWQDINTGIVSLNGDYSDLTDAVEGTGDAAEAAKKKMLGFDELNVLGGGASATSSAGTSTGAIAPPDTGIARYANMDGLEVGGLEDLTLGDQIKEDIGWLTTALTGVKDNLSLVKDLALGAGTGFLGWKIAGSFGGDLKTKLGLTLAMGSAAVDVKGSIDAWNNGINNDNLNEMLIGSTGLTLGLGTAFGKTGFAAGALTSGIGLTAVALKDWITTGKLTKENLAALLSGLGLTGMGVMTFVSQLKTGQTSLQAVSKAADGTGTAFSKVAKKVGVAALGVFDAVMVAYDAKMLIEAGNTYHEAQLSHNRETETALNSYAKLYQEKGKEVADEWAKMVYQVDTTNMSFDEAQKSLTEKIEGYWDGVPQNMWQGFKQGWNTYFGEGGSGVIGLVSDAATSIGNTFKNILGIHSPSTVFAGIGEMLDAGLVQGLHAGMPDVLGEAGDIASALTASIHPDVSLGDVSGQHAAAITASGEYDNATMDSLLQAVLNVYDWLQTEGSKEHTTTIDGRAVFETVIAENNRAIRRTGTSPIRG